MLHQSITSWVWGAAVERVPLFIRSFEFLTLNQLSQYDPVGWLETHLTGLGQDLALGHLSSAALGVSNAQSYQGDSLLPASQHVYPPLSSLSRSSRRLHTGACAVHLPCTGGCALRMRLENITIPPRWPMLGRAASTPQPGFQKKTVTKLGYVRSVTGLDVGFQWPHCIWPDRGPDLGGGCGHRLTSYSKLRALWTQ